MQEIRYTDEAAMCDLIALARSIMDTVNAKGIDVSVTAMPDNNKSPAFVTVNAGDYTYTEFYGKKGNLVDASTKKQVRPKDVMFGAW